MKLKTIMFDTYIQQREEGQPCELAFQNAMNVTKDYVIQNYSEDMKSQYNALVIALDNSNQLTQEMELTFKLKGRELV